LNGRIQAAQSLGVSREVSEATGIMVSTVLAAFGDGTMAAMPPASENNGFSSTQFGPPLIPQAQVGDALAALVTADRNGMLALPYFAQAHLLEAVARGEVPADPGDAASFLISGLVRADQQVAAACALLEQHGHECTLQGMRLTTDDPLKDELVRYLCLDVLVSGMSLALVAEETTYSPVSLLERSSSFLSADAVAGARRIIGTLRSLQAACPSNIRVVEPECGDETE
jgi:hypothetical protein